MLTRCNCCKDKTESINRERLRAINNRVYEKSECKVCGKTKSIFLPRAGPEGGALTSKEEGEMQKFADFAGEAYKPLEDRKDLHGYLYQKGQSNKDIGTWVNNDRSHAIVSLKGSNDRDDIIPDAKIAFGKYKGSKEYKARDMFIKNLMSEYGNDITLTGHSRAGTEAHHMGIENGLKSHSFNPGTSIPQIEVPKNILENIKCKFDKEACDKIKRDNKVYITGLDPISVLSLTGPAKVHVVKPTHANVHGIKNFQA